VADSDGELLVRVLKETTFLPEVRRLVPGR
jgi:hypothetical protein